MLGEAATKEIAVNRDTLGFDENRMAANMGGTIARNAREELEQKSGKEVISNENYFGSTKPKLVLSNFNEEI